MVGLGSIRVIVDDTLWGCQADGLESAVEKEVRAFGFEGKEACREFVGLY